MERSVPVLAIYMLARCAMRRGVPDGLPADTYGPVSIERGTIRKLTFLAAPFVIAVWAD